MKPSHYTRYSGILPLNNHIVTNLVSTRYQQAGEGLAEVRGIMESQPLVDFPLQSTLILTVLTAGLFIIRFYASCSSSNMTITGC